MKKRFDSISVGMPAQSFEVRSHVSVERLVPVMTEFALRLLNILGPISAEVLQNYFGLSSREIRTLLSTLRLENLIEDRDELIALTPYAIARFEAIEGGTARFSRIVERVSHPTFELLTYTPLPKPELVAEWDNSISLMSEKKISVEGNTIDRVYEAYFQHFHDIERFAHNEEERRAVDVYKIDEVTAGRRINIPYPVHFDVDQEGEVEFAYEQETDLPAGLKQQLSMMATEALTQMPSSKESYRHFASTFNEELISRYTSSLKGFDLTRYVKEVHAQGTSSGYSDTETDPFFGALHLRETITSVTNAFKTASDVFRTKYKGLRLNHPKLYWVAPKSQLWGRSQLLREAVSALEEAGRTRFSSNFSVTIVRALPSGKPDAMRREAQTYASAGFREVIFAKRDPSEDRTELLVFPGVFAIPLYHCSVPSKRTIAIPVGYRTLNETRLRIAQKFLFKQINSAEYLGEFDEIDSIFSVKAIEMANFSHLEYMPQDRPDLANDGVAD